jgi:hypothetical protein
MKLSHCRVLSGIMRIAKIEGKCYLFTPKAIIPVAWDCVGLGEGQSVSIVHDNARVWDDIVGVMLARSVSGDTTATLCYRDRTQLLCDWVQIDSSTKCCVPVAATAYPVPAVEYAAIISKLISESYVRRLCKAVLGLKAITLGHCSVRRNGGGIVVYIGGLIFCA